MTGTGPAGTSTPPPRPLPPLPPASPSPPKARLWRMAVSRTDAAPPATYRPPPRPAPPLTPSSPSRPRAWLLVRRLWRRVRMPALEMPPPAPVPPIHSGRSATTKGLVAAARAAPDREGTPEEGRTPAPPRIAAVAAVASLATAGLVIRDRAVAYGGHVITHGIDAFLAVGCEA